MKRGNGEIQIKNLLILEGNIIVSWLDFEMEIIGAF